MGIERVRSYIDQSKVTQFLRRAFASYFFPFVTAAVIAACYMLALDIVAIWYLCICATAILVCCKDVSPALCILIFFQIFVSIKHCPSTFSTGVGSDYFFATPILAQEIIAVAFVAFALVARTIDGIVKHRFVITRPFWGIVILSVALLFNGSFYTSYSARGLLYGFGLGAILIFTFVFTCGNVEIDKNFFVRISLIMLALCASLSLQLIYVYCTIDGLVVEGVVNRALLFLGWGTYNNLGMLFTICIPAWFYLAGRTKYGFAFLLGAALNIVACFLSMSRQAMMMSVIVAILCCIWIILRTKGIQRIINASVIGGVLLIVIICCAVMHEKFAYFFSSILISLSTGSGRTPLWNTSINNFFKKPLFGVGFFDKNASYNVVGYFGEDITNFIPRLSHNTIFQFMSSCGLTGLLAYLYHRAQTIVSLINNFSHERILIGLILAAFLLCCLLDCYIFYFLPTAIYAFFVAILAITESKNKKSVGADKVLEV